MQKRASSRTIVIVAYDQVQMLDLVGPLELFHGANLLCTRLKQMAVKPYEIEVVNSTGKPFTASNGFQHSVNGTFSKWNKRRFDTLLIPGALVIQDIIENNPILPGEIRSLARNCRRVATLCSGTFLLAEAGLISNRHVTTHWAGSKNLQNQYPLLKVDDDQIYLRDGRYYSSGGATAAMDLTLALIEEDLGSAVALELARWFVMFLKRPGGQSQFSVSLQSQFSGLAAMQKLTEWIVQNPGSDCSVEALARRANMSLRNFTRVFQKELKVTPSQFVLRSRLETACRQLVDSDQGLKSISIRCGFGTEESLRRAFQKHLNVSPGNYRRRFQTSRLEPSLRGRAS
jgi:transcriptional regulator GlxA family with amidase domain